MVDIAPKVSPRKVSPRRDRFKLVSHLLHHDNGMLHQFIDLLRPYEGAPSLRLFLGAIAAKRYVPPRAGKPAILIPNPTEECLAAARETIAQRAADEAAALAAGVALPLVSVLGYTPGSAGSGGAALSAVYCLVPCLLKLASAALLWHRPPLPSLAWRES